MKDFPIAEYQIVQNEIDKVTVKIVLLNDATDFETNLLHRALAKILEETEINLQIVEFIPRSKTGKLRTVIPNINIQNR